jgi:hypothetical protein
VQPVKGNSVAPDWGIWSLRLRLASEISAEGEPRIICVVGYSVVGVKDVAIPHLQYRSEDMA